jgi:hypothetical protein
MQGFQLTSQNYCPNAALQALIIFYHTEIFRKKKNYFSTSYLLQYTSHYPTFFTLQCSILSPAYFYQKDERAISRNLQSSMFPVSFPCNNKCITSHDTPDSFSAFLSLPFQRDMKRKPDIAHFMWKLSSLDAAERRVLLLFRINKAPIADFGPESEWPERYFHISTARPG